jgi:uncharacterized membrane protein
MTTSSHHQIHLERRANAKKELYHSLKAKADAEKSFPVKLADRLTGIFGTLSFLVINVFAFAIWIIVNVDLLPGVEAFDPFPFGFLTMVVSLEAIILAIVILISQNQAAIIGDLRQEVDLQVDVKSEAEITKLLELVTKLLEKNGVDLSEDDMLREMLKPTDIDKIQEDLGEEFTVN